MMMELRPGWIHLKEKIALCTDFTSEERDLILDTLNLSDHTGKHSYPSRHGPGSSDFADVTWSILDALSPDKLSISDRYMLGGMLTGALFQMYQRGKKDGAT